LYDTVLIADVDGEYKYDTNAGAAASPRRRSVKGPLVKSPVWKFFVPGTDSAKCRLCLKWIKRTGANTSNLTAHLRTTHRAEYEVVVEESARRKTGTAALKWVRRGFVCY